MTGSNETILVTGGSGFVGAHCVLQGIQKGYQVHTTIRSLSRADDVKQMLRNGGATEAEISNVKFFAADLMKDDGWKDACAGCSYVLHVASPFPAGAPKHEDDLIVPAREGTLRVLRAAKEASTVKRVIITSSMAAIGYGYGDVVKTKTFTEEDWTILDGPRGETIAPYQKSKAIAERAAWDWIAKEGSPMELTVINPVAIFGPALSADFCATLQFISRMLNGQLPAMPNLAFETVDVRDVADLHFRAMTSPKAAGQRYLALRDGGPISLQGIAQTLKRGLPAEETKRVGTMVIPNFVMRFAAMFQQDIALIVPEIGRVRKCSNAKAKRDFGWQPRDGDEAILSAARSLQKYGVVKP
ncbi:hypothetical protein M409DRAFT_22761 [Zasmidium cellare ATCC 36951]|uniref:NAD-dependent epimerase/dehydratase domain-containing protein n=1 Tax=Zasmidium cellare ATCC 36951 TaxID=1080233 RepID=A0A6A6CHT9_ZASCE|nr:uncharacterized protein M409DRAFT_22761 [Zasmidium cellare ATCC 36951]KAF2166705.1 hypothetical protein M409DRAFT_22761 [Zasmidium cellare ATCC 36951]